MEVVYPYIPMIIMFGVPIICYCIYCIVDRVCSMKERKYAYYGKDKEKEK